MGSALNPSQLPASENGRLMTNQSRTRTSMVPKGTAPEAPRAQRERLRRKKREKIEAGRQTGVYMKFRFHPSPLRNL